MAHNTLVLFGIATFVTVSITGEYMCTDKKNLRNVRLGERLSKATFLSQIRNDTKGFMLCARDCLLRKRCKSFNFETITGMCELNQMISSEGGELTSDKNFVYADIAHVNKALAGVCESHLCTEDQVCQSSNSEPICFQCGTAECGVCSDIRETSNITFLSLGCFYSREAGKERPLNNELGDFDEYDKITEKEEAINACAEAAHSRGYELFGLEEFFKCYGGNFTDTDTVLRNPVGVDECTARCSSGIGFGEHAMLVYHWL